MQVPPDGDTLGGLVVVEDGDDETGRCEQRHEHERAGTHLAMLPAP